MDTTKKPIVNTLVYFNNWTEEDFSHPYGGDPMFFPANELTLVQVGDQKTNEGIRDLMAYHLAIRECNRRDFVPASKVDPRLVELVSRAQSPSKTKVITQPKATVAPAAAPADAVQINTVPSGSQEDSFEGK